MDDDAPQEGKILLGINTLDAFIIMIVINCPFFTYMYMNMYSIHAQQNFMYMYLLHEP